jgi:hypothetical protein
MKAQAYGSTRVLTYFMKGLVSLFALPILSVWLVGSALCAGIAVIGGLLGTLGVPGIGLSMYSGQELPNILSLPVGAGLAAVLLISSYYTRRLLLWCLRYLKS